MPSNAMLASVGWSAHEDAFTAGDTAAKSAIQNLETRRASCAIVFASSWYDQIQLLAGLHAALGATPIVGGSTAGEITPEGPKSQSCVVVILPEEGLPMSIGVGTGLDHDARMAGYQAAQQALRQLPGGQRSGMLFFGDGLLSGCYAEALRGIQEVLGTSSLVTGGLMADDMRLANTFQYANGRAHQQAIVALLFGGSCRIGVGIEHGFSPISKPRRITKAHGNVLEQLDGQPASSVYEEYFGAAAMEATAGVGLTRWLIAYPLGIQQESNRQFLLRNVMAFGQSGSLLCSGDVTEGSWVQLMIGSKELALEAASFAAQQAVRSLRSTRFVLVFDSAVRRRLLGRDATAEIMRIRLAVGSSVPVAGCYTYGEQAPRGGLSLYGQSSLQTGACLVIAVGS